jgi:hypothetical protein
MFLDALFVSSAILAEASQAIFQRRGTVEHLETINRTEGGITKTLKANTCGAVRPRRNHSVSR